MDDNGALFREIEAIRKSMQDIAKQLATLTAAANVLAHGITAIQDEVSRNKVVKLR